ncbi:methyltransferase domain-containing protein [Mucilaginibacter calamicampi]|uniref:Methyltransferase domain-containing protein n=1 Tax=Mucilaginibacter calamicampi TaxID=1302352 RepID=A0ABW2YVV5_9SPHI
MEAIVDRGNEYYAAKAFTAQSGVFDSIYAANTIVAYKRDRVRTHVLRYLKPGGNILELNSGTGDDAVFFAEQGFHIHATDVSPGMQQQLQQKVKYCNMEHLVSNELCSFTQLHLLKNRGPFDHIFSNFAGLNCTGELDTVLSSLPQLLKPGGVITLVILPKFCLWESLLIFKGKFKTATRRWFSKYGVKAHVEGTWFTCWYYNPSHVINAVKAEFDLLGVEGLCTLVPPSYIEGFAEKYPRIYTLLKKAEDKFKTSWPWKFIGDYYIITLQKK